MKALSEALKNLIGLERQAYDIDGPEGDNSVKQLSELMDSFVSGGVMKPEHLKLLADRDWRLNNLYWITDKEGKPTRFRMTPEQREYSRGIHTRNIILKARQLGFTTEVCIIQLDAALFESAKCALIAHTLNDAKRLFREKVKYAYDKLPAEIKASQSGE